MPQNCKIIYLPVAIDDMDEVFSYISKDNIASAETLLERLAENISNLSAFPHMGSILSEDDYHLVSRGYRFIVVHPYLVFYRIINNTVIIHRILHGRRDYLRELFTTQE